MSKSTNYQEKRKEDLEKSLKDIVWSPEYLLFAYLFRPLRSLMIFNLISELFLKVFRKISRVMQRLAHKFRRSETFKEDCAYVSLHVDKEALKSGKKICLFSHFSAENRVDPSVLHYLKELKENGFTIAFGSTSESLDQNSVNQLKDFCDLVLVRDNIGLDFGSWSLCHRYIQNLKPDYLAGLEGLLFANDSLYGPLFSLKPLFSQMAQKDCDFWGLTDNFQLAEHVQSYFLYFNESALKSQAFRSFIDGIKLYYDKKQVILQCEVGLTEKLVSQGLKYQVCFPYEEVAAKAPDRVPVVYGSQVNSTIFFWDVLVGDFKFPFIKRTVFKENTKGVLHFYDPKTLVSEMSSYPTEYLPEYDRQ